MFTHAPPGINTREGEMLKYTHTMDNNEVLTSRPFRTETDLRKGVHNMMSSYNDTHHKSLEHLSTYSSVVAEYSIRTLHNFTC